MNIDRDKFLVRWNWFWYGAAAIVLILTILGFKL
jgi:hypothetical protein